MFPTWATAIAVLFMLLETRRQYGHFFTTKVVSFCVRAGVMNEEHETSGYDARTARLLPRTEDVLIYSVAEFNDKVPKGERGTRTLVCCTLHVPVSPL